MNKAKQLIISFHNPNPVEDLLKELIKLSAQLAVININNKIIHSSEASLQNNAQ